MYSYESDFSLGGEWWIGRRRGKRGQPIPPPAIASSQGEGGRIPKDFWIRDGESGLKEDVKLENELDSPFPLVSNHPEPPIHPPTPTQETGEADTDGVLKARISGNWVSPALSR